VVAAAGAAEDFQTLAQGIACAVEHDIQRCARHFELVRDECFVFAVQIQALQDNGVTWFQGRQEAAKTGANRRIPVSRRVDPILTGSPKIRQETVRSPALRLIVAIMIGNRIAQNPIEPSHHSLAPSQGVPALQRPQETLLKKIVGLRDAPDANGDEPMKTGSFRHQDPHAFAIQRNRGFPGPTLGQSSRSYFG
jgi:hypothetical protein